MKKLSILCLSMLVIACQDHQNVDQTANFEEKISVQQHNEKSKLNAVVDINGQWEIIDISGGPVKVYPGGKGMAGIDLDLNQVWKGGKYEFYDGIGFLELPNVSQQQIGNYKIQGNQIIFDGENNVQQTMTFDLQKNQLNLTLSPDEYKKIFANAAMGGKAELEVTNPLVFHLRKI